MSESVVIIGASGHAGSVSEAVYAMGLNIAYYVSQTKTSDRFLGRPVKRDLDQEHVDNGGLVVLAIGDNWTRARLWQQMLDTLPDEQLPAIVHPSAIVAATAQISGGSVVLQGAVIGAGCWVKRGSIVNTRASLDHDSLLGDFSSLAPGVVTGGRVVIGKRTAVSLAATIKHEVAIGDDVVVGASSYVNTNVPDGVVAYGTPARIIRSRKPDAPYLT